MQAKRHLGNWLFCFKKPPKAEDASNENTHYQRAHVRNIKMSFFSFHAQNRRHLCLIESIDDKAFIHPGTSEGLEKTRNTIILTLTDVEKARKLPKYDWPVKEVYQTPASHRILAKKPEIVDGKEKLVTDCDHYFVFVRPNAIVGSTGTVWASETVKLRHQFPEIYEVTSVNSSYSKPLKQVCAKISESLKLCSMMTEENDVEKITSNILFKYRAYEALRVSHLNRQLNLAVGDFELTINKCSEGEYYALTKEYNLL